MEKIAMTEQTEPKLDIMRQAYRPLTEDEQDAMQQIKAAGFNFHTLVESLGQSREISLAKTKVEEAVMWAVKHLTR
jgi:predicted acetyltransferase